MIEINESIISIENDLLPGVGNEVLISFILMALITILLGFYIWKNAWNDFEDLVVQDTISTYADRIRPPSSTETCPICLNQYRFTLETNCGHRFCGECMIQYHETNRQLILRSLTCPMCRTQINLIFPCYTTNERNIQEGAELYATKRRVNSFISMYNRMCAGTPRSIWSTIREIPVLARHYLNEVVYGGELTGINYLNLRILLLFIFSNIYLILPTDILPERIFGLIGWIDDFLLFGILIWSIVREIPVFARHYLYEVIFGGFNYINLRILLLFISSNIYLILPEKISGLIGWIDDFLLFGILILYLATAYRQLITNNDFGA